MENALKILEKNYNCKGGSFLYYLSERNTFNREEYNKLVNCINGLTEKCDFSRGTGEMIRDVQLQTVLHITYHFNPADGYEIEEFPEDIFDVLEDLRCAADIYFNEYTKIKD